MRRVVGSLLGELDGGCEGKYVGEAEGVNVCFEGKSFDDSVGELDGDSVDWSDGKCVGISDGKLVGTFEVRWDGRSDGKEEG